MTHTFTGLCKRCFSNDNARILSLLGLLLATSPSAALAGLPCELTIPDGFLWSDYFQSVGNFIEIDDDECGMHVPLDSPIVGIGGTAVVLELSAPPHRMRYDLVLDTSRLTPKMPAEIVVLDMVRDKDGVWVPVVELRLDMMSTTLELVIFAENGTFRRELGGIESGVPIAVELTRSLTEGFTDGVVRFYRDNTFWGEANGLSLWESLPTAVRLGAVKIESELREAPLGILEFQPLGLSQSYYAISP